MPEFEAERSIGQLRENDEAGLKESVADATTDQMNEVAKKAEELNFNAEKTDDVEISQAEKDILEAEVNAETKVNLSVLQGKVELQRLLGHQEEEKKGIEYTLKIADKKIEQGFGNLKNIPLIGDMFNFSLRDYFWNKWFGMLDAFGMSAQKERYQAHKEIRDATESDSAAGKNILFAGITTKEWKEFLPKVQALRSKGHTLKGLASDFITEKFAGNLEATKTRHEGEVDVSEALSTEIAVNLSMLVAFGESRPSPTPPIAPPPPAAAPTTPAAPTAPAAPAVS